MDGLTDLRAALKAAPPAPDPGARARAIALAVENFDRARRAPQAEPPAVAAAGAGLAAAGAARISRLRLALRVLLSRPALTATTSVAALALGAAVILPLGEVLPQRGAVLAPAAPEQPLSAPAAGNASSAAQADAEAGAVARAAETAAGGAAPLAEAAPPVAEMSRKRAVPPAAPDLLALPQPAPMAESAAPGGLADQDLAGAVLRQSADAPVASLSLQPEPSAWQALGHSLELGYWPGPGQISPGALVNAFDYGPDGADAAFTSRVAVQPAPWDPARHLVSISLTGSLGGRLAAEEAAPELSVIWDPQQVTSYRLLGHDSRDRPGRGLQMTALYEVELAGKPDQPPGADLALLRLNGNAAAPTLWEQPLTGREAADADARFAAAIAGFALILQGDSAVKTWSLRQAADLAEASRGADPEGARAEAVRLIRRADSLPD